MNSTSDIEENLVHQQQKDLPGGCERIFAASFQLLGGLIAIICGVTLFVWRPEQFRYYVESDYFKLEQFGNSAFGLWIGLISIVTATFSFFRRNKKTMVGFYFGFCLVNILIAACGTGISVAAINKIFRLRMGRSCGNVDFSIPEEYPCCFDPYYYCGKVDPNSASLRNYYSKECELKRELPEEKIEECRQEAETLYAPQMISYGIVLAALSVVFFASIFGASAALLALCKCCSGRQKMPLCTSLPYHPLANNVCNNFAVQPPEAVEHPGHDTFEILQVPEMSPPPYTPPQRMQGNSFSNMYEVPM